MKRSFKARVFWVKWRPTIVLLVALTAMTVVVNLIVGDKIRASIEGQQRHSAKALADSQRKSALALFKAQVGGCERQNLRTISVNLNARANYRFDSLFLAAVAHPLQGQPRQSAAERRLTARFIARLRDQLATLGWTPINQDCATVPSKVELPVAFSIRQPAPADIGLPRPKHHK